MARPGSGRNRTILVFMYPESIGNVNGLRQAAPLDRGAFLTRWEALHEKTIIALPAR